jgi:glutamine synthetase
MEAADAVASTRETIAIIAAKNAKRATFTPRVYKDSCKYGRYRPPDYH